MNIALLIYTIIFIAILYLTCSKYEYFPNVLIYTIGMGLLPTLFSFNGFGNLIIVLLFRFVIGLILIAGFEKYGYHLTDEELNQKVEEYKEMQINIAESRSKSMDTKQAFKTSLIVCSICCVILFVIFHLKNAQYNELFGNSFGSNNINDNMKGLRRVFFGRWF